MLATLFSFVNSPVSISLGNKSWKGNINFICCPFFRNSINNGQNCPTIWSCNARIILHCREFFFWPNCLITISISWFSKPSFTYSLILFYEKRNCPKTVRNLNKTLTDFIIFSVFAGRFSWTFFHFSTKEMMYYNKNTVLTL